MDIIIQAIVRIFEALFEQDLQRRKKADPAQRPKGPPQQPPKTLLDWLRENIEIEGLEEAGPPQPQATSRPARPQPAPPPPPEVKAPAKVSTPLTRAQPLKPAATRKRRLGTLKRREKPRSRARGPSGFSPGRRPLEKLIWAQVILGPCKANRHQRSRRVG